MSFHYRSCWKPVRFLSTLVRHPRSQSTIDFRPRSRTFTHAKDVLVVKVTLRDVLRRGRKKILLLRIAVAECSRSEAKIARQLHSLTGRLHRGQIELPIGELFLRHITFVPFVTVIGYTTRVPPLSNYNTR